MAETRNSRIQPDKLQAFAFFLRAACFADLGCAIARLNHRVNQIIHVSSGIEADVSDPSGQVDGGSDARKPIEGFSIRPLHAAQVMPLI